MPDHIRLSTQIEPSTTKGSMVRTDTNNRQEYFSPSGADQTIVTVDLGGGHYEPQWTAVAAAFSCSDLNTCSIDELSDVDTTSVAPVADDLLYWDGANFVPVDAATVVGLTSIGDHSDVNLAGLANTQVLAYNSGTGDFEPSTPDTFFNIQGDKAGAGLDTIDLTVPDTLTFQGGTPGIQVDTQGAALYAQIELIRDKEYFTPIALATVVTLAGDVPPTANTDYIDVYRNGLLQTLTTHYSYDGTAKTITFVQSFDGIEDVQVHYFRNP